VSVYERLETLNIALPKLTPPVAAFVPFLPDYTGTELRINRSMWRSVVSLPKTRASRDSVPIIPALPELLGAYRRSTGNPELGFVFRCSDGLPISLDIVQRRVIRPALEAIGLPWRGWHAFRRGLASNLYAMGVPDKAVQCILRHSRPHVTKERYIKVFDRTVLEAAEKLQIRIEELRKTKEPCPQLELWFGDGVEQPPTVLSEYPAFSRLADSSLSGLQLASTSSGIRPKAF